MEKKQTPNSMGTAILIAIVVFFVWQTYMTKKYPNLGKPVENKSKVAADQKAETPTAAMPTTVSAPPALKASQPQVFESEKETVIENERLKVVFTNYGGKIKEIELKNYIGRDGRTERVVTNNSDGFFGTTFVGIGPEFENESAVYHVVKQDYSSIDFQLKVGAATITKHFGIDFERSLVSMNIYTAGLPKGLRELKVTGHRPKPHEGVASGGFFSSITRGDADIQEYYFEHGTTKDRKFVTEKDAVVVEYDQVRLASLGSRFFTTVFFNKSPIIPKAKGYRIGEQSVLELVYPVLDERNEQAWKLDLYAGPKSMEMLSRASVGAESVIDYGFFSWLALPMLGLMRWFYSIIHNWGIAIILLTVLVRTLTFPFTYMSFKSMKGMQKLQPELARIREIYKNDSQRMNLEAMKLMRENKVSPMGGCLPVLLQLPVFIALYAVLQNSVELYRQPFMFWIHDLSAKDPFFVLPVLMGITMFVQQKMTPTTMDPAQAKAMAIMPIIMSIFMLGLPSGLTLYIFVSTLFGISQQFVLMMDKEKNQGKAVVRQA